MNENQSKDALMDLLNKIKEETGLDLTDKADKVVVMNMENMTPEKFEQLMNSPGSIQSDDAEELNKLLDKGTISQKASTILRRAGDVDGWQISIDVENTEVEAVKTTDDTMSTFSFNLRMNSITYISSSDKWDPVCISVKISDKICQSPDPIMTAMSIVLKHVDLCKETYGYTMPSTELCDAMKECIFDFMQMFDQYMERELMNSSQFQELKENTEDDRTET